MFLMAGTYFILTDADDTANMNRNNLTKKRFKKNAVTIKSDTFCEIYCT